MSASVQTSVDDVAAKLDELAVSAPSAEEPAPQKKKKSKPKKKALEGANALELPPIRVDGTPHPKSDKPTYLVRKKEWKEMPEWILLEDERDKSKSFPALSNDLLFQDDGPLLLPYDPPEGATIGKGAAVICPGGNYEFLHPREGYPIARWVAERMGIRAYVLRYRLLPKHGLNEMHEDLRGAVKLARQHSNGGPVIAFGFSAGGHLVSSTCAAAKDEERPDAQVLVYPCINPDGWLVDDECGFSYAETDSPQVKSLINHREGLRKGKAFVKPPPTFLVASTADWVCPVDDTDPYIAAAKEAGCEHLEYIKGDHGDHGFGLKRFWADKCASWLEARGCGAPAVVSVE